MQRRVAVSWSGGKDSALALYDVLNNMYVDGAILMTTYTEEYNRVSMHGVRLELVEKQAASLGLDLLKIPLPADCSNEIYEDRMAAALQRLRSTGVFEVVFGDIFLEDVRRYREKNLERAGFKGIFPLWGFDTARLARRFLELGFRAVICCVDTSRVPPELAGRELESGLLDALPGGVDPCGENGEFHTFVYDGPIFSRRVDFELGERVLRHGKYLYVDLIPTS